MINFDHVTKQDIKEHNPNQLETPDHPGKIWRFWIGKNKCIT